MATQNIDFLIVGQGLAGSLLAEHLRRAGATLRVLSSSARPSASRAAAGLYNPITGRKMVKTWRADDLFSYLTSFYPALEQRLEASFFHPLPIYRPFRDAAEQNEWAAQADNIAFARYVQQVVSPDTYAAWAYDERGGLLLRQCGYLDVPSLLTAYQRFLQRQVGFDDEAFDANQLMIQDDHVTYKSWRARRLVFCDGVGGARSGFFDWLPFRPVKGEIMRIRTERELPLIFNRGVFVIPQGRYGNVGSTYDHQQLDDQPTERGTQTLRRKLEQLLKMKYEIVDQWAGVRPATQDRRPLIGNHPRHEPLAIFNGFGSKGVSLAPYFAQHFVHCLSKNQAVDEAVDIRRFYHHYPASTSPS